MKYLLIVMLAFSSSIESFSSAVNSPGRKRNSEKKPWQLDTLPNAIEPILYNVTISPHFSANSSAFIGSVSISLNVVRQTNTIILHAKQLNITGQNVYDGNGKPMTITKHFANSRLNDYFVIQTLELLQGKPTLHLSFSGTLVTVTESGSLFTPSGFYKIPYFDDATQKQSWLLVTDFRPSYARYVFPNFDEPRFKARFRITIRHWRNCTALSNMPEESHEDVYSFARDTTFKLTPKMSSHLVGFAVTDFQFKKKIANGIQLRVWAQPDYLERVDYALDVTPTIQTYLHRELDMPYSLQKLDQLAVPGDLLSGQRENWGLVTYKESKLLFDAKKDGGSARYEPLTLIASAMARNYFGNLVTCKNWEHVWLDEALATFFEIRAMTAIKPSFLRKEFFYGKELDTAINTWDAGSVNSPLIQLNAPTPGYDIIRSDKGASILRMLENFVGADAFKSGIRQYLRKNANGSVVTDDLWNAIQQQFGDSLDIKTVMKNWVERNGLPVVQIDLLQGGAIHATQKRFLADPSAVQNPDHKWYVPLTYRTSAGKAGLIWMNLTDISFRIPLRSNDQWVEFNVDRVGYYRVNYHVNLWYLITKQLNKDHTVFSELSRSKMLSDAAAMVKAGQLGFEVFLDLIRYASKEKGLAPWYHICEGFLEIRRFSNTTQRYLHNYILNLTSNLMGELRVKDEGTYMDRLLRPRIIAMSCSTGHKGCIENVARTFKTWINNEKATTGSREYLREVFCYGIANSLVESDWKTTLERYKRAKSEDEKLDLVKALSCSRNISLLERLLDFSIDQSFTDDAVRFEIVSNVASNPSCGRCAWEWLKRRFAKIDRAHGEGYSGHLLPYVFEHFNTLEQYQELLSFYIVYRNADNEEDEKEAAEIHIISNMRWLEKNLNPTIRWIALDIKNSGKKVPED